MDRTFTQASVFIRGDETEYERAGSGGSMIILVDDPWLRFELSNTLSEAHRVIVPDTGGAARAMASASTCEWLRGLLVGLGIEVAGLILDEEWSLTGLRFALAEPDRVNRLVLLSATVAAASPRAGIEDRFALTGQRLLMIEGMVEAGCRSGLERIAEFFSAA